MNLRCRTARPDGEYNRRRTTRRRRSLARCQVLDGPPVAVACDLLGGAGLELLIGYTRLGNLLALLDREEVPEVQKHLVWVGRRSE